MTLLGRYFLLANIAMFATCMPSKSDERIEDGEEPGSGDFSFTARIQWKGITRCNGVLVDREWVSTLANCIDVSSLSKYKVFFRVSDSENGNKYVKRKLESAEMSDDGVFIMLKLDKKVLRNADGVRPFNRFSNKKLDEKMTDCKAVGFSTNGELSEVGIEIKPTEECPGKSGSNLLCVDALEGAICEKDGGTPIMCKLGTKWYLMGLLSAKDRCESENIKGFRVSYYTRSIKKAINKKEKSTDGVCTKAGCVKAASRLIDAIDTNVNPCDDFYEFACGTWMRDNVIPEDRSYLSVLYQSQETVSLTLKVVLEETSKPNDPEAVVKARNFYKACLATNIIDGFGLTLVHQYMEDMGGLPVLGQAAGGKWDPAAYDVEDLLSRRAGFPLMSIFVIADLKDPTTYMLYIDQPSLGMSSRDYFLYGRDHPILAYYENVIRERYLALGANETAAAADAKEFVDFEVDLANITVSNEDRIDIGSLYNKMTLGDLSIFTGIDLKKVIQMTLQRADVSANDATSVVVLVPDYFEKLGSALSKYPDRVVTNYVVGRRAFTKNFYLPQELFSGIEQEFVKVLDGSSAVTARWESCIVVTNAAMKEAVGRLFVEEAFKEKAKSEILDSIVQLKKAFKDIIDRLPWLSEPTKKIAKKKVDFMSSKIGYPDKLYDDDWLNSLLENVTIYDDNPFANAVTIEEDSTRRALQLLGQDVDKTKWQFGAAVVNAFYSYTANEIIFLAGILQPPMYSIDQPDYLNYGAIGTVIGHEITHGFDNTGRNFNKKGILQNWWTAEDAARFQARAQCLVDQYNSYVIPGTGGQTGNGLFTLGENIADNGGLKESFEAYQNYVARSRKGVAEDKLPGLKYSPAQLFFLNFAQVWCRVSTTGSKISQTLSDNHSLARFRVIGSLQNYDEFSNVWNCPAGSYMNPTKKCSVW